ncbi:hypothetical protein ACC743_39965, partial [Rhizobium ruizarguesonis]
SVKHELAEKNIRIQAVLPGATSTEFWDIAGTPVEHLPNEIVMSAENMVDASRRITVSMWHERFPARSSSIIAAPAA